MKQLILSDDELNGLLSALDLALKTQGINVARNVIALLDCLDRAETIEPTEQDSPGADGLTEP